MFYTCVYLFPSSLDFHLYFVYINKYMLYIVKSNFEFVDGTCRRACDFECGGLADHSQLNCDNKWIVCLHQINEPCAVVVGGGVGCMNE